MQPPLHHKTRQRTIALFLLLGTVSSCQEKGDKFVEIHGQQQHVLSIGKGRPVVIFLSGRGDVLSTFDSVQKEISKVTRTFSYDRAGLGESESLDTVRTFDNMIKELNEILEAEDIEPPYILVGHSMGGSIARYYYHLHKDRVVGIVLIDPGHEDDIPVLLSLRSEPERRILDSLIHAIDPGWPTGFRREMSYSDHNDKSMKGISQPIDIPVTLLISVKWNEEMERKYGETKKDVEARTELISNWLKGIPGGKQILTNKSGHFIHKSEPELVANEIKYVIESVRSTRR